MSTQTILTDGLYIAFDADCATCADISQQIEEATAHGLRAVPLEDDAVRTARRSTFGEELPHEPTLIRAKDGDIRCWLGPRMSPVLIRELGWTQSMRVLQVLGIERTRGQRSLTRPPVARRFSRRALGQVTAGLAAATGLMMTGSFTGVARAAPEDAPSDAITMDTEAAQAVLQDVLHDVDIQAIAPVGVLDTLAAGQVRRDPGIPEPGVFIESAPDGETSADGRSIQGTGFPAVFSEVVYSDGTRKHIAAISPSDSDLLVWTRETFEGVRGSKAELFRLDAETESIELAVNSRGGVRSEPVPDAQMDGRRDPQSTASNDPCGGCMGSARMYLNPMCETDHVAQCVLKAVGCARCAITCRKSGFSACMRCLVAKCGGAVRKCCERVGQGVCFACKPRP